MRGFADVAAFGVVLLVALGLISYMLYQRALAMGHERPYVGLRLAFFWLGCLLALAAGIFLHVLYPQGLFDVNFSRFSPDQAYVMLHPEQARTALYLGLGTIGVGALIAWLAVRPLQTPPPGAPEEPPA